MTKNENLIFLILIRILSSRMAIIDLNSVMKIVDLTAKVQREDFANFKRNDVWDVVWAADNPDTFVTMEKIKMHIFRDTVPEVCGYNSSIHLKDY